MLHLKQDCASAELKKKTVHMLSFSYFAVVFLNKMDQRFPYIFKKLNFRSGNCGTVQFYFQSITASYNRHGKRRQKVSPESRLPAAAESPVAEFVSDSVTAAAQRAPSATLQ